MKLGKVGLKVAMSTGPGQLVMGFLSLIHWVLGWFVMSVVVFVRKDFGERYLSWVNIMFGAVAVGLFCGLGNMFISWKHGTEISWMIGVAYNLFLLCAIIHRVKIWRRNKRGEQWHSYNPGVSIFRIPRVSLETQSKWIDPAIIWTISVITYNLNDHTVTNWLQIGSLSLIIHEQVSYYLQRQALLDMIDAQIESRNWAAVMSGKPVRQTQGYTIAESNVQLIKQEPDIQDAFAALPDDVKAIMDQEAA